MVKLNNKRIKWFIDHILSGDLTTKEASEIYKVSQRRIQILVKQYKEKGFYPVMNPNRRPKTELAPEQKKLIEKGYKESFFGARMLRHHIRNKHGSNIPQNKIHAYMREKEYAKPNKRKQKPRKRCRYEREHSLQLLHLDWTEFNDKQVLAINDDRSRKILALGEYINATTVNTIKLFDKALEELGVLAEFVEEANTDRGTQFFSNRKDKKGKINHKFLDYLDSRGIKHVPSRRKNPQTNGKMERWFQEYKKHRNKFKSSEAFRKWFNNRIHGGLKYNRGEMPNKALTQYVNPGIWIGLFFRSFE
jgi:putative transposase